MAFYSICRLKPYYTIAIFIQCFIDQFPALEPTITQTETWRYHTVMPVHTFITSGYMFTLSHNGQNLEALLYNNIFAAKIYRLMISCSPGMIIGIPQTKVQPNNNYSTNSLEMHITRTFLSPSLTLSQVSTMSMPVIQSTRRCVSMRPANSTKATLPRPSLPPLDRGAWPHSRAVQLSLPTSPINRPLHSLKCRWLLSQEAGLEVGLI